MSMRYLSTSLNLWSGGFGELFMSPIYPVKLIGFPRNICFHLCNNFLRSYTAINPDSFSFPPNLPPHQKNKQEWAKLISTQVSNCTNLRHLNHFFAHIIKTQMLSLYNAPFYWNNILRSYTRLDSPHTALCVFIYMARANVVPDCYTLPIVLKAVGKVLDFRLGLQLHVVAIRIGLQLATFVESGFISLYSKRGELECARKVFDESCERKLGSWNAFISGLVQGGHAKEAAEEFIELKRSGFEPDAVTMVSVTSACGSLGDLGLGLQLHKCVYQAKSVEKSDMLMCNSLIDMYGKCGRMDLAYKVFPRNISYMTINPQTNLDSSPYPPNVPPHQKNSQEWAKLISAQVSNCTNLRELNKLFALITRTQILSLYNAPFYWNNIIRSYTRLDSPQTALCVYIAMVRDNVVPDCYTLPIVLKAVGQVLDFRLVPQLHAVAIRIGLQSVTFCESGFISLYSKGGEFECARKVFDENCERELGSWNAIIGGLAQGGRAKEAVNMFIELKRSGFEQDDVTMVSVTSACGSLGDLDLGLQLHKCVYQATSLEKSDLLMCNSLIDMYGKCGCMDLAYKVFSGMSERNVSSWTSMIVGYAMHGHSIEAFECFCYMREAGVRPNYITFVGVLTACVHGGNVLEGKYYFNMMKNTYGIKPLLQHYGCMVDLLGRVGLLEEAREMVEGMPMPANVVIWGCLMGACEKFGNVEIGEWVAKHLKELEPWNDGVYVVLSNIYASKGMWEEVDKLRKVMKVDRLAKIPGYSLATNSN